jgi:hypothetical protein
MKLFHITVIILATALAGQGAEARIKPYSGPTKTDNPDYAEMYTSDGHEVDASQAFMDAIAGKKVYHCQIQEAAMGKTGRTAGLKNVPKKK